MEEKELISLYKTFYSKLCILAFRYLQDKALAEDVVQNFFLSLIKKDATIHSNPYGFLKRSIINACISELNQQKKLNFLKVDENENLLHSHPVKDLETSELKTKIKLAIKALPPKCRTIFLLKRKENYTNKEIAEFLSISVKTVENQITIALKQLHNYLNQ